VQVFHRSTNVLSRFTIFGGLFVLVGLVYGLYLVNSSPYVTKQGVAREQPVQFSHKHHAGELGIDCRYCHTTVEKLAYAGMPATKTCMNCHSQIWTNAPILEPVRASYRSDTRLSWIKVNDLPDFVYFNHQIHVNKGVGCVVCHGQVDKMPLMYQEQTLQMEWCITCNRNPENFIRPRKEVFNMGYTAPTEDHPRVLETGETVHSQVEMGLILKKQYKISSAEHMTTCSVCHR